MALDTLPSLLHHQADTQPDRVWMKALNSEGSIDWTWSEARDTAMAIASVLEEDFGQGERMVILSRNCPHWILADMAIIASGNIAVSMFTTLPSDTADYILSFTSASLMFVGETSNWPAVREVLPEGIKLIALPGVELDLPHLKWDDLVARGAGRRPNYQCQADDLMSLVFTSGTTGNPKGVMQTHASNLIPIRRLLEIFTIPENARYLSYLPLAHIAERQIVEFSSLVVCGEVSFNESLETILRDLQRTRPHVFFGPPRIWEQFQQAIIGKLGGQAALDQALEQDREGTGRFIIETMGLGEVVFCLTAAAPTPPALIHWFDQLGLVLMEGFGQTEAMGLIVSTEKERRIGSVGKPVPRVDFRIADNGELLIRAEGCTPGYYREPEKTAELLKDGWLHTGDKARVDEDGFIYITGRVKDYFKTIQGKFVAPPPIEGAFAKNPHIEQQCLLGRGFSKTVMVAVLTESACGLAPEQVERSVRETVAEINSDLEPHARIGAVILSCEPWGIENGVLTPTMKIRRDQVDIRFAELAEQLARSAAEQGQVLLHWSKE
ncbi:AMP-binding protein [Parahaliea sp. F7430]|uniref:AMP-binding protein n=1 Tax=Sediminihaliea albiluteola TaxID=2758564 RepID=A0A7W2TU18_9GAMM|nr:AMP-binding protein [Sediminihaliea albiluteola]MBA6411865.1 AMP-binding protein [Sediminihaliea albiluteola]